jgi:hypothetical protein
MPPRVIDMMPVTAILIGMMMRGAVMMVMMMNMRLCTSAMAMISRTHCDALYLARLNPIRDEK